MGFNTPDVSNMVFGERITEAELEHLRGNMEFRLGNVQKALDHYLNGLLYIDAFDSIYMKQLSENLCNDLMSVQKPLWLNVAACYLKQNEFEHAILFCDKVLHIEDKNIKALYRKAIAFQNLNNYEKALHFVEDALKTDPDDIDLRALKDRILVGNSL